MRKILILWTFFPLGAFCQNTGIHFEQQLSWHEILEKASKENKYIFLDCYTTWCGPCRFMAKEIFPKTEVGTFMNAHFISVSVQLDTTAGDDDRTKSWYADAHTLATTYEINVFPTYLFFAPDGHIVHRAEDASPDPGSFLSKAADAIHPETQYYTLIARYTSGERDSSILRKLSEEYRALDNKTMADEVSEAYVAGIKNVYDKSNLGFIGQLKIRSGDPLFRLWMEHSKIVDSVMGGDYAERKVMNEIMEEDSNAVAAKALPAVEPDWTKLNAAIKLKYGVYYANRIEKWLRMNYFRTKKEWKAYADNVVMYVEAYRSTLSDIQLNGYAWDIFSYSDDRGELSTAESWSKSLVGIQSSFLPYYYDTYANLLYKLNRHDNRALATEKRAIELFPSKEKAAAEQTLAKMETGQRTWAN